MDTVTHFEIMSELPNSVAFIMQGVRAPVRGAPLLTTPFI